MNGIVRIIYFLGLMGLVFQLSSCDNNTAVRNVQDRSTTPGATGAGDGDGDIPRKKTCRYTGSVFFLDKPAEGDSVDINVEGVESKGLKDGHRFAFKDLTCRNTEYQQRVDRNPEGFSCIFRNTSPNLEGDCVDVILQCALNTDGDGNKLKVSGSFEGLPSDHEAKVKDNESGREADKGETKNDFELPDLRYGSEVDLAAINLPDGYLCRLQKDGENFGPKFEVLESVSGLVFKCEEESVGENLFDIQGVIEVVGFAPAQYDDIRVATGPYSDTPDGGVFVIKNVPLGHEYDIQVEGLSDDYSCGFLPGSTPGKGTVTADIVNIKIKCTTETLTISGTVSGILGENGSITAKTGDALSDPTKIDEIYAIQGIPFGSDYDVMVINRPVNYECSVDEKGKGSNLVESLTDVNITCQAKTINISGVVFGLESGDTLVVRDADNPAKEVLVESTGEAGVPYSLNDYKNGDTYKIEIGNYDDSKYTCELGSPLSFYEEDEGVDVSKDDLSERHIYCKREFDMVALVISFSGDIAPEVSAENALMNVRIQPRGLEEKKLRDKLFKGEAVSEQFVRGELLVSIRYDEVADHSCRYTKNGSEVLESLDDIKMDAAVSIDISCEKVVNLATVKIQSGIWPAYIESLPYKIEFPGTSVDFDLDRSGAGSMHSFTKEVGTKFSLVYSSSEFIECNPRDLKKDTDIASGAPVLLEEDMVIQVNCHFLKFPLVVSTSSNVASNEAIKVQVKTKDALEMNPMSKEADVHKDAPLQFVGPDQIEFKSFYEVELVDVPFHLSCTLPDNKSGQILGPTEVKIDCQDKGALKVDFEVTKHIPMVGNGVEVELEVVQDGIKLDPNQKVILDQAKSMDSIAGVIAGSMVRAVIVKQPTNHDCSLKNLVNQETISSNLKVVVECELVEKDLIVKLHSDSVSLGMKSLPVSVDFGSQGTRRFNLSDSNSSQTVSALANTSYLVALTSPLGFKCGIEAGEANGKLDQISDDAKVVEIKCEESQTFDVLLKMKSNDTTGSWNSQGGSMAEFKFKVNGDLVGTRSLTAEQAGNFTTQMTVTNAKFFQNSDLKVEWRGTRGGCSTSTQVLSFDDVSVSTVVVEIDCR